MSSPTARTLDYLRKKGYTAGVVERYNSFTKQRHDLFGCIDIVAIHPDRTGCLGVQATSGSNGSSRVAKIVSSPAAKLWLASGNALWVVVWSQKGAKGKRKLWTPGFYTIYSEDFANEPAKT